MNLHSGPGLNVTEVDHRLLASRHGAAVSALDQQITLELGWDIGTTVGHPRSLPRLAQDHLNRYRPTQYVTDDHGEQQSGYEFASQYGRAYPIMIRPLRRRAPLRG